MPTRTRTLPQMLTPFVGILTNLYSKMPNTPGDLDSIKEFVSRSDSFDLELIKTLHSFLIEGLQMTSQEEATMDLF